MKNGKEKQPEFGHRSETSAKGTGKKKEVERIRQRIIKQVKEHNHVPKKEKESREKTGGGYKNKGNFQKERQGNTMPELL